MAAPSSRRPSSGAGPSARGLSVDPADRLLPSGSRDEPPAAPAEPRFYREAREHPRAPAPRADSTLRAERADAPRRAAPREARADGVRVGGGAQVRVEASGRANGLWRRLTGGAGERRPPRREPGWSAPADPRAARDERAPRPAAAKTRPSSAGRATRTAPPPPPPPPSEPPRPRRSWSARLLIWGLTLMIWVGIFVGGVVAYYAVDLPDIDKMTVTTRRPSVVLQSAEGEVFAAFGDLYGEPLTLPEISPNLVHAVLATEDRRFFSHFGIDVIGLARAVYTNLRVGHVVQGGSTVTQQ
ncbi:MAG: hypothetical protein RLZZ501_2349, partial [Pseudomonadota bacterium]